MSIIPYTRTITGKTGAGNITFVANAKCGPEGNPDLGVLLCKKRDSLNDQGDKDSGMSKDVYGEGAVGFGDSFTALTAAAGNTRLERYEVFGMKWNQ